MSIVDSLTGSTTMALTADELDSYRQRGYVLLPRVLDPSEVDRLRHAISRVAERRPEAVLHNAGDGLPRLVFGPHQLEESYGRVVSSRRVLEPAAQLLDGQVYVHQTKVTLNTPQGGEGWPWHQDYAFWRTRDNIPGPHMLSAAVFLDDVTHVNGPLFIVPGSHQGPVLETGTGVLDKDAIAESCAANGIDVPLGPAGSVLYFDGKAVHGSSTNISPLNRRILYITYNRVDNLPSRVVEEVPDFVAARVYDALRPTDGDIL